MIPILQLNTQYDEIQEELEAAVLSALRSTAYINGPDVAAFEQEFAHWHGVSEAAGVGSGTDALHLAVRALDLGPEDEVISPAFTFIASAGAIALAGAKPAFCDVDPITYNIDTKDLERRINKNTKAIVVVHLFGHPAPMDEIFAIAKAHGLAIIEDCAQATGAEYKGQKVGTMGDFGCFSFFPSKNLGGAGDGGMVFAKSPDMLEKVRVLKSHGSQVKYYHDTLGTNSRLDTLQAAALRVKLKYLSRWNEERRRVAFRYIENLKNILQVPVEAPECKHVFHQFTVRVPRRDEFKEQLQKEGVGSMIYYPVSLHQQKAFLHLGYQDSDFPVTRKAQEEVLSLPMFPELKDEEVDFVCERVKTCLANNTVSA